VVDIAVLGKTSIKLKGKGASFVIDPSSTMPKTAADAIVLSGSHKDSDLSRVTDARIVIDGPGEFEAGGVKISGIKIPDGIIYRLLIDSVSVVVGRMDKYKGDASLESQVAVVNAGDDFNESALTSLDPKVVVLYGDSSNGNAKKLGAENVSFVSKVNITKDKLPDKMEVSVLG
jgi:hypothetical protein